MTMFTSLTTEQAEDIAAMAGYGYHHHDSVPRKYEGYDQPYIHIYDQKYARYVVAVGCDTGAVKFSELRTKIDELDKLHLIIIDKLLSSEELSDGERHRKLKQKLEVSASRNNLFTTTIEIMKYLKTLNENNQHPHSANSCD